MKGRSVDHRSVRQFWSEADVRRLMVMRDDEAMEWEDIAAELGRPVRACSERYQTERYRAGRYLKARSEKAPSNKAVIDAERREAALAARSLTGSILGDPPPGYSALDRQRAGASV